MKMAIPTLGKKGLEEMVSEHFGRCDTYTLLDDKGNFLEVIDNTSSHNGGKELPPEILKKYNVDILLCKGLGPRALEFCKKLGIIVYVYSGNTVKEIMENWKNNCPAPATMKDICEEHRL